MLSLECMIYIFGLAEDIAEFHILMIDNGRLIKVFNLFLRFDDREVLLNAIKIIEEIVRL